MTWAAVQHSATERARRPMDARSEAAGRGRSRGGHDGRRGAGRVDGRCAGMVQPRQWRQGAWKDGVADGARLGWEAGGGCVEGEAVRRVAVVRARRCELAVGGPAEGQSIAGSSERGGAPPSPFLARTLAI